MLLMQLVWIEMLGNVTAVCDAHLRLCKEKKDFRKTSRLNWPKSSKWEKKHRLRMSQIIKHTATIAPRNKLPCPGTLNEK